MVMALVCSARDLEPEIGHTVLFRHDVERLLAKSADEARTLAQARRPQIVIVDRDLPQAERLIKALRADAGTRRLSIAVVASGDFDSSEVELLEAGANAVLRMPAGWEWEDRLLRLIEVPARKDARFSVYFKVDALDQGSQPLSALALNLSVRGLLIESTSELQLGHELLIQFRLPDLDDLVRTRGRVVRMAGARRYGIEFVEPEPGAPARIRRFIDGMNKPTAV
jgi:CheY-like chemotaxis protein